MKYEATDNHPIFNACLTGDAKAVQEFLAEGIHPYANGVISAAIRGGHPEVFQVFLDQNLDLSQPLNIHGETPIFRTIAKKQMAILELLIAKGASVDYDPLGSATPLHAASERWPEAIPVLLNAGADVNAPANSGRTPLMGAALRGQLEALELLAAASARLEDKDSEGTTALILAARAGKIEAITWLLDHGAEIHAKDNDGKTAEDWARENGHGEIADFLSERKKY